jgi:hypothetical protein
MEKLRYNRTKCMRCSRISFGFLRFGLLGLVAVGTNAQPPTIPPLSANDVSWLFPPPVRAEDFGKLIAVRDLIPQNDQDPAKNDLAWSIAAFQQFLKVTASPESQVNGSQIGIPIEAQSIDVWFIAGVRIDAGAPGLSDEINGQFGRSPQIRLIVQPVTRKADGTPNVFDIAGHLVFNFMVEPDKAAQDGCLPRLKPDMVRFKAIVADLAALRTKLRTGQLGANKVTTSGVPLGVHPGLADVTTASKVRQEMKDFLQRNVSDQRLFAMAIVGVPLSAPTPWIFLSMQPSPNGGFVAVHGPTLDGQQTAQMFTGSGVFPAPHTNNLNKITCQNAAISNTSLPTADRKGSSTADLFGSLPTPDKIREILDLIADPQRSHFFNTDCVSCHTETRRAISLLRMDIPGIDPAVLPKQDYTVRNFGWAPPIDGVQAVVTRRTAAETAAVVEFINSQMLK